MEKELRRVRGFFFPIKNTDDLKLPCLAAIHFCPDRRQDWNTVTDFPMKEIGRFPSDDRAGTRTQPRLFLFRGQKKFRIHVEQFLRHTWHLGKKMFRISKMPTEPREVRRFWRS